MQIQELQFQECSTIFPKGMECNSFSKELGMELQILSQNSQFPILFTTNRNLECSMKNWGHHQGKWMKNTKSLILTHTCRGWQYERPWRNATTSPLHQISVFLSFLKSLESRSLSFTLLVSVQLWYNKLRKVFTRIWTCNESYPYFKFSISFGTYFHYKTQSLL